MRVLVAIDLNDDDLTSAYGVDPRVAPIDYDDLVASLDARASEFYCGRTNDPVRGRVVAVGDFTDNALADLLAAAEVGADGIDDDARRDHVIGSLATMRQHLNA